ncbi:MAG: sugar transferase [Bowdeniella nasicola]|nr:sugar transferase [Bowdeniella nasicola]
MSPTPSSIFAAPALSHRTVLASVTLVDATAIGLAGLIAWIVPGNLPFLPPVPYIQSVIGWFTLIQFFVWFLFLKLLGAYDLRDVSVGSREYRVVLHATASTASLFGVVAYLFNVPLSRTYFVLSFVVGAILLLLGRFTYRRVIHRYRAKGRFMRRTLIAGSCANAHAVALELQSRPWLGLLPVGSIRPEALNGQGTTHEGDYGTFGTIVQSAEAEVVLITDGYLADQSEMGKIAWALEPYRVSLIVLPSLSNVAADRIHTRPVAGMPFVWVERPRSAEALSWGKRLFDFVGASLGWLLVSPLLLLIALSIKLEDGGPVCYRQTRIGRDGQPFLVRKFRSMVPNADTLKAQIADQSDPNHVLFKIKSDPRITRVGAFIRKHSLDELPQLVNVIRGEMSLIGPRPCLPEEAARYTAAERMRLRVRPGITGLWQVSGRSDLAWDETIRLDLYYVDNWSVLRDAMILLKTIKIVVTGAGAY